MSNLAGLAKMWFWPASSGRGSMAGRFVAEAVQPFHPVEALVLRPLENYLL